MVPIRHVIVPALATVTLVVGLLWVAPGWRPVADMPDKAAIRKASTPKPTRRLRCDPDELVADAPPGSAERRIESELYRAIVEASPHARDPLQLVVEAVSIPMPGVPMPEWFKDWSPAAFALIEHGFFQCSRLSADRFPQPAHLVPVGEIADHVSLTADAWASLASRYNGARQWFAFSRARVNETTGDAIVYYDRECHSCGVGEWVWFHREAVGAPWRIAGKRWSWIN